MGGFSGKDTSSVVGKDSAQSNGAADLAALLSSQVRASVLRFAITHPDVRFSLTELGKALDLAVSSVQHECYKLERLGVLRGRREGSSRRYALQSQSPVVQALKQLMVATVGVPRAVEAALSDLPGLEAASLLGAIPAETGSTALVLNGDLSLETVEQAHHRVAWLLHDDDGELEIVFFRPADWLARRDAGHPLVRRLLDLPVQLAFGEVREQ